MSFAIPLSALSAAFGDIVRAMMRKVCDIVFEDCSTGPMLSEMCLKLHGLIERFNAIAVRVQAGTLRAPPRRPEMRRSRYRLSAQWPKECTTRPPRRRAKHRSTAGPPSTA